MLRKYLYGNGGLFEKSDQIKKVEGYEVPNLTSSNSGFGNVVDGDTTTMVVGLGSISKEKTFIKLEMFTPNGKLDGKIWTSRIDADKTISKLEKLGIVEIDAKWNEWPKGSGKFSVVVENFVEATNPPIEVLPVVNENLSDLKDELFHFVEMIEDVNLRDVCKRILSDTWSEYCIKVAAKGVHHYEVGGLLQHTVENLRIVTGFKNKSYEESEDLLDKLNRMNGKILSIQMKEARENGNRLFSPFFDKDAHMITLFDNFLESLFEYQREGKSINFDVVIFSMIFHDIGKLIEYKHAGSENLYDLFFPGINFKEKPTISVGTSMDEIGSRLGHITLGIMYLTNVFNGSGVDGEIVLDILSCISSHHGRLDWGSPTKPETPEEYLVHIGDLVGSRFAIES